MKLLPLAASVALAVLAQQASAAFVEDTKASLSMRNFAFDQDYKNQGRDAKKSSDVREWGQGFVLNVQSGFTEGTVGVGVDAIGLWGIRLDGGGKNNALFPQKHNGDAESQFGHAGITGKVRFSKTEARYGTLQPKLPILVSNDGRLLPQLFEGTYINSKEIDNVTLHAGLIEHAVGRASTNSTGLSVGGGKAQSNKFWFGGADWQAMPDLTLQYYYAKLENFYQQNFLGGVYDYKIADNQSLKTDLRYFRSTGEGRNKKGAEHPDYRVGGYTKNGDGKIDNNTWSAAFTYSIDHHSFMLGHQRVSEDSNFVYLNQGDIGEGAGGASFYLLTDRLANSFIRAGERTSFADYTYDFAGLGIQGLKAGVTYLKGTNVKRAGQSNGSEWERDLRVDYTIQEGTFKGVGFGARHGVLRGNVSKDVDQSRLFVNYTLPLL
mgnify:FL=1